MILHIQPCGKARIMQKCLDNLHPHQPLVPHLTMKYTSCKIFWVYSISCLLLLVYGNYYIQESESVESQALNNVVMLADLISISLQTDTNGSANFSVSGESISKWLNFYLLFCTSPQYLQVLKLRYFHKKT